MAVILLFSALLVLTTNLAAADLYAPQARWRTNAAILISVTDNDADRDAAARILMPTWPSYTIESLQD